MSRQLARNLIERTENMEAVPRTYHVAGAYFDLVKDLCKQHIELKDKDHVSKKALREWCEKKLKRLSILRNMDHSYFEKFSAELLDQFCSEGE
jgi:hypothetical protein